jgi:hypothetical protein
MAPTRANRASGTGSKHRPSAAECTPPRPCRRQRGRNGPAKLCGINGDVSGSDNGSDTNVAGRPGAPIGQPMRLTEVSEQAWFPNVRPPKRHSNIRPPKRHCRRPALGTRQIGVPALHLSAADRSPTGGAESPPPHDAWVAQCVSPGARGDSSRQSFPPSDVLARWHGVRECHLARGV